MLALPLALYQPYSAHAHGIAGNRLLHGHLDSLTGIGVAGVFLFSPCHPLT